jgi:hypothetical protein
MADEKEGRQDRPEILARPIDRREFLRIAALGGVTVGAGGD